MESNFKAAVKWVNRKMKEDWKYESGQSPCGFGSFANAAKDSVKFINNVLCDSEHNIQSVLDLGCGDWNWFKNVDLQGGEYQGWDAGVEMIERNQRLYSNEHVQFHHKDIVTCTYPRSDLIICRDVLFHMPMKMGRNVVDNIQKSSEYFICTSFNEVTHNTDIGPGGMFPGQWGFYRINVNVEPFNLKPYLIDTCEETGCGGAARRYVNLYKFS